jgi:hypothetical protein
MLVFLNVAASYAAWFAVATLASHGLYLLAVLPSLAAVSLHLALTPSSGRRAELLLIAAAIALGVVVEAVHMAAGATRYSPLATPGGLPPAFMIGLWAAFATLVNVSLAWLKGRVLLACVFGAVASGPSYYAGSKLGALELGEPVWQSLLIIGMVWAVAFPVLLQLALVLDRTGGHLRSWKKS